MYGFDFSKEPRAIREAREEETLIIITRLIKSLLKQELPEEIRSRLIALPLPVLEDLAEALLDFNSLDDLENWITEHC